MQSFDDGGVRINPALHTYARRRRVERRHHRFPPTVDRPTTTPVAAAGHRQRSSYRAQVNDRESPITSVTLSYTRQRRAQPPVTMTLTGGVYMATIPAQPDGTRVDYTVTGTRRRRRRRATASATSPA